MEVAIGNLEHPEIGLGNVTADPNSGLGSWQYVIELA